MHTCRLSMLCSLSLGFGFGACCMGMCTHDFMFAAYFVINKSIPGIKSLACARFPQKKKTCCCQNGHNAQCARAWPHIVSDVLGRGQLMFYAKGCARHRERDREAAREREDRAIAIYVLCQPTFNPIEGCEQIGREQIDKCPACERVNVSVSVSVRLGRGSNQSV